MRNTHKQLHVTSQVFGKKFPEAILANIQT